jgi:hypothetical protein
MPGGKPEARSDWAFVPEPDQALQTRLFDAPKHHLELVNDGLQLFGHGAILAHPRPTSSVTDVTVNLPRFFSLSNDWGRNVIQRPPSFGERDRRRAFMRALALPLIAVYQYFDVHYCFAHAHGVF